MMRPSVKNVKSNPPKTLSKREEKKQIDRKLSSGLFFQIGLIISLLAVIFLMETTIGYSGKLPGPAPDTIMLDPPTIEYTILKPKVITKPVAMVKKSQPLVFRPVITQIFTVQPDKAVIIETPIATTAPTTASSLKTAVKSLEALVDVTITRNVYSVEFVPVFPGCESLSTNEEKSACMSSKIGAFISRRFNSDAFRNLKTEEQHKIWVQFKIDRQGNVTDVVARAPQEDMKDEGVRVLRNLPKMIPGKMGDVPVPVSYMVPITFRVQ